MLLVLALGYPLAGATSALAFAATTIRWSSGWLVAVTGAQAVLGSALVVGPAAGALSSWLAAAAIVIAVPHPSVVVAVAAGVAAALVVAGPGGWSGADVRIAASLVLAEVAWALGRAGWARQRAVAATALGVLAVAGALAG